MWRTFKKSKELFFHYNESFVEGIDSIGEAISAK